MRIRRRATWPCYPQRCLLWVAVLAAAALAAPTQATCAQTTEIAPNSAPGANLPLSEVEPKTVILGTASSNPSVPSEPGDDRSSPRSDNPVAAPNTSLTQPTGIKKTASQPKKAADARGKTRQTVLPKKSDHAAQQPAASPSVPLILNATVLSLDVVLLIGALGYFVRRWAKGQPHQQGAPTEAPPNWGLPQAHFQSEQVASPSKQQPRPVVTAEPQCEVEMLRVLFEQNVQLREQLGSRAGAAV